MISFVLLFALAFSQTCTDCTSPRTCKYKEGSTTESECVCASPDSPIYDVQAKTCITQKACEDADKKTVVGKECVAEAECTTALPVYNAQDNTCITETACTGKSANGKTYIAFNMKVGTTEKKVCVEKKTCESTKYYLPYLNDCVEGCATVDNFVADDTKTPKECSCKTNYVFNSASNPIKCECKSPNVEAEENGQKRCEARADCSKDANNNKYRNPITNKCVANCDNIKQGQDYTELGNECVLQVQCTDAGKPYYFEQTNECFSQTECTGRSANGKTYIAFDMKVGTTVKKVCAEKKTCESTKFYVPYSNDCVDACSTADNFVADNSKTCVCKTNYGLNLASNPVKCECQSPNVLINGECQVKPDCSKQSQKKIYDSVTNTCVETCPAERSAVVNNECKVKTDCSKNANKYRNPLTNECVANCDNIKQGQDYTEVGNECVLQVQCTDAAKPYYFEDTNECMTEAACKAKSTNGKTYIAFTMKVGTTEKKVCAEKKTCENTKFYVPYSNECVDACSTADNFVADNTKTCVCKENYGLNLASKPIKCECPAATHEEKTVGTEKKCIPKCDAAKHQKLNTAGNACECINGYVLNTGAAAATTPCTCPTTHEVVKISNVDKCLAKCGENEQRNGEKCDCKTGFEKKNNKCVKKENNGVNGLFVILAMALFFLF